MDQNIKISSADILTLNRALLEGDVSNLCAAIEKYARENELEISETFIARLQASESQL